MAKTQQLIILGAGGVGLEILEMARLISSTGQRQWEVLGFLDDNPALLGKQLLGATVLGALDSFTRFPDACFVSSIGHPDKRWLRRKIRQRVAVPDDRMATLVHPAATVSPSAVIGAGSVIYPGCHVGAMVKLGSNTLLAYATTVGHECEIGDHTVLASGVNLSGEVIIGSDCYFGAGAAASFGVNIGSNTLICVGSILSNDVPGNTKFMQSFLLPKLEREKPLTPDAA